VTALATSWPAVLGAAWTAVGVLVLAHARHRAVRVLGVLGVALGVCTEPMLAVPFAAGIAAMLVHDQLGSGRPPWWPAQLPRAAVDPRHEGGDRPVPAPALRTGPRHGAATSRTGGAGPSLWLSIALLVPFGAFGAALASGGGDTVLDGSERAVLLLVLGLVVGLGLVMRRLRPPALAAAALVGPAALPWSGAGAALALTVLVAVALAALLTDVLVRRPAEDRPHPLLRLVLAVPAIVVTLVGGLFLPVTAPLLPHRELAEWMTGPSSAGGIVAVPVGLWGDLLRDDVPADRLVLTTTPGAFSRATWKAEVGDAAPAARSVAEFGAGPSSVTVVPLPPAGLQARAEAAELRATEAEARAAQAEGRAVAADLVTRQRFGTLLAASPRLQAPPDVLTAFRNGSVDGRVLVVLAELTAEHRIQLGPLPEVGGEDPAVPRHRILINGCDCSLTTLTDWLRAQPLPFAPAAIEPVDGGLTTAW
jgi:putative peptide zinc metalloprotease protein